MVTAMAAAMTATLVAAMAMKTTMTTVMVRGTDNNQLKPAAEETVVAAATETAMALEMAPVTAAKIMPTPIMGHQQQQQGQCIREVPSSGDGNGNRNSSSNNNGNGDGDCNNNDANPNTDTDDGALTTAMRTTHQGIASRRKTTPSPEPSPSCCHCCTAVFVVYAKGLQRRASARKGPFALTRLSLSSSSTMADWSNRTFKLSSIMRKMSALLAQQFFRVKF